jgi:hypothetical protein
VAAAPILLLLSIVPIVGPVAGLTGRPRAGDAAPELLWSGAAWASARGGAGTAASLAESLGFGAAALVVLMVPREPRWRRRQRWAGR